MCVELHEGQDIVAQDAPECVDDTSSEGGSVQEASNTLVPVCVAPDAWAEPRQESSVCGDPISIQRPDDQGLYVRTSKSLDPLFQRRHKWRCHPAWSMASSYVLVSKKLLLPSAQDKTYDEQSSSPSRQQ